MMKVLLLSLIVEKDAQKGKTKKMATWSRENLEKEREFRAFKGKFSKYFLTNHKRKINKNFLDFLIVAFCVHDW